MRVFQKDGWWFADLTAAKYGGFGIRSLKLRTEATAKPRALMAAAELYATLRFDRGEHQLQLAAPRTLAGLLDSWIQGGRWCAGTTDYYTKKARRMKDLAGHYEIGLFLRKGGGRDTLAGLVTLLHQESCKSHYVNHLLGATITALRFGAASGWWDADEVPEKPNCRRRGEEQERRIYNPRTRWSPEDEFWTLHDLLYVERCGTVLPCGATRLKQRARFIDLRERRQCYLVFAYYTAAHRSDVDATLGKHLNLARGMFMNRNTKNRVDVQWDPLAPRLLARLQQEWDRRGGWKSDELVFQDPGTKKPWAVDQTLKRLAIAAKVEPLCLLDFRRSWVTRMLDGGMSERRAIAWVGHSSSRMVREVYGQVPRDPLHDDVRRVESPLPRPGVSGETSNVVSLTAERHRRGGAA